MSLISAIRFLKKTVKPVSGATFLGVAVLVAVIMPSEASAQATFPNGTSFGTAVSGYQVVGSNIEFTVSAPVEGCVSADGKSRYQMFKSTDGTTWSYYSGGGFSACIGTTFHSLQTGGTIPLSGSGYYAFAVGNNFTGGDWYSSSNMLNVKYVIFDYNASTDELTAQGVIPSVDIPKLNFYSTHDTRFIDVTPNIASTSPTTFDLDLDLEYFLELSEIDTSDDSRNLSGVRVEITHNGTGGSASSWPISVVQGTSTDNIDISSYRGSLDDGHYDLKVGFTTVGSLTAGFVFPRTTVLLSFDVENGVVTNLTKTVSNGLAPRVTDSSPTEQECSITQIGGCLINAFQFVFYPSTESLTLFSQTYSQLEYKAPFVYAYQAGDLLTGMYTGTADVVPEISVETGIGEITFISQAMINEIPFVSLLRSLIAAGLWIMLFTVLYRKTLSIHDKQTV